MLADFAALESAAAAVGTGAAEVPAGQRLAAGAVGEARLARGASCALNRVAAAVVHFPAVSPCGLAGLRRAGLADVAGANLASRTIPIVCAARQLVTAAVVHGAAVGAFGVAGFRRAGLADVA